MFKIAICDDERHFRELIHRILEEYMGQTGMVYQIDEFQSGEELLCQGIELVKYQVVFLDVNMTGFTAELFGGTVDISLNFRLLQRSVGDGDSTSHSVSLLYISRSGTKYGFLNDT